MSHSQMTQQLPIKKLAHTKKIVDLALGNTMKSLLFRAGIGFNECGNSRVVVVSSLISYLS